MRHEDIQKWITVDTAQHLDAVIEAFETCETFTHDNCAAVAKELAATVGIKLVNIVATNSSCIDWKSIRSRSV